MQIRVHFRGQAGVKRFFYSSNLERETKLERNSFKIGLENVHLFHLTVK